MSAELRINLGALKRNYKFLDKQSAPSCETACPVKANAYGLGADRCAPALYEVGARSFFVANIEEAIDLRKNLTADDAQIYVLGGMSTAPKDVRFYMHHKIIPVINSPEEIQKAQEMERFPVALHFDTAMSRLGFTAQEAERLYADPEPLKELDIRLVISHFSSSEEALNPVNDLQIKLFTEIIERTKAHCPDARYSLANSGGVFLDSKPHFDLLRPGIALYGGNPSSSCAKNPMEGCVNLDVPVLQVKAVKKGEGAGYNATYIFEKDSDVAILSVGYADGLMRTLSNKGVFYWRGYPLPVRGRISMDLTICDLSAVPENEYPVRGDMVEIIGKYQNVDDLASAAGTIPYEILTSLGHRYKRIYR